MIQKKLKSTSEKPLILQTSHRAVCYLFQGLTSGKFDVERRAFDNRFFPEETFHTVDQFGEGFKVLFPIRFDLFLQSSPKRYVPRNGTGTFVRMSPVSVQAVKLDFVKAPVALSVEF